MIDEIVIFLLSRPLDSRSEVDIFSALAAFPQATITHIVEAMRRAALILGDGRTSIVLDDILIALQVEAQRDQPVIGSPRVSAPPTRRPFDLPHD